MAKYQKPETVVTPEIISHTAAMTSAATATLEPETKEVTSVEAETIELGYNREMLSLNQSNTWTYFDKVVRPKYPKRYIAMPSKEHAREEFRGWRMLFWDTSSDTVKEVKDPDEATKTSGNILCWMDIRIKEANDAEWRARQRSANKFVETEGSSKEVAAKLSPQLQGLSHGMINASPLKEKEADD